MKMLQRNKDELNSTCTPKLYFKEKCHNMSRDTDFIVITTEYSFETWDIYNVPSSDISYN